MLKLKKKTIFLFILSIIALYLIITIVPKISDVFTPTEIIQYGNVKISDEVNASILRDELVYTAGKSGQAKHFVEEGSQIKKGTPIMEMAADEDSKDEDSDSKYEDIIGRLKDVSIEDNEFVSQRKSILTYYVDGYENYFNPKNIKKLNYEKTKKIKAEPINFKKDNIKAKEPIYKLCENSKWYIAFWIEQGQISKYEVGNTVTVLMPKGEVKGKINEIIEQGDLWLVSVKTNRYYENFTKERTVEASVLTTDKSGLLISNGAITTKDNQVGVYVKETSGDFSFKPVQTIVSDGKKTLVAEDLFFNKKGEPIDTVKAYDEILKKPKVDKKKRT